MSINMNGHLILNLAEIRTLPYIKFILMPKNC